MAEKDAHCQNKAEQRLNNCIQLCLCSNVRQKSAGRQRGEEKPREGGCSAGVRGSVAVRGVDGASVRVSVTASLQPQERPTVPRREQAFVAPLVPRTIS